MAQLRASKQRSAAASPGRFSACQVWTNSCTFTTCLSTSCTQKHVATEHSVQTSASVASDACSRRCQVYALPHRVAWHSGCHGGIQNCRNISRHVSARGVACMARLCCRCCASRAVPGKTSTPAPEKDAEPARLPQSESSAAAEQSGNPSLTPIFAAMGAVLVSVGAFYAVRILQP